MKGGAGLGWGGGGQTDPPPEKSILKKASLIRVKKCLVKVFIKKEVVLKASKREFSCVLPFIRKKSLELRTAFVNSTEK